MAVVGGHHRNVQVLLQPEEILVNPLLFLQSLVLNLQKEISPPENIFQSLGRRARRLVLALGQPLRHFALQTRRQPDQPFAVLGQIALAHPRLVVKAVQRSLRADLGQVLVAGLILGQHNQMVVAVALRLRPMVFLLADVQFAAQNGLDPRVFGVVEEMHRAEDVAVVRHGNRRHLQFLGALAQHLGVAGAVQHGVVGMKMEMNKLGRHS